MFSPALSLARAWLVRQSLWLRHFLDWLNRDAPDDYARYEAMPINATAETFLLTPGNSRGCWNAAASTYPCSWR